MKILVEMSPEEYERFSSYLKSKSENKVNELVNQTEKPINRMRLLNEAYNEIKALDPKTSVTKTFIRSLALNGKVPVVMVGKKRLINLDALISYIQNPQLVSREDKNGHGKIRPVKSKDVIK